MHASDSSSVAPKPVFSLVLKSARMSTFAGAIIHNAKRGLATPLMLGANILELNELARFLARTLRISTDDLTIDRGHAPKFTHAYRLNSHMRGLVLWHGDRMQEDLQAAYTNQRLRLKFFMPVITRPLEELSWTDELRKCCAAPATWPSWEERHEDHGALIDEMRRYIQQPFTLDQAAETYLRSLYNTGTRDVFHLLRRSVDGAKRTLTSSESVATVTLLHLLNATPNPSGAQAQYRSNSDRPGIVMRPSTDTALN